MHFRQHSDYEGRHAFLSASKYHWINYDEEKLDRTYLSALAAAKGDRLHKLAAQLIREGLKLAGNGTTMSRYVNDAIGFKMTPEQILFYSPNSFGTADAISFRRGKLRVHDLKTGVTPTSEHQLEIYAALFCLEYNMRPFDIEMELRIYQNDDVAIFDADPAVITLIMDKIITFDKRIEAIREEALQ